MSQLAGSGNANGGRPEYVEGRYWVSPLNFVPEVRQSLSFPDPIVLYDSTLRKILYVAGLRTSIKDLLDIATALEEVGIKEMFLNLDWWGDPNPDPGELELCREILKRDWAFKVSVASDALVALPWQKTGPAVDNWRGVVDLIANLGARTISPILGDMRNAEAAKSLHESLSTLFEYVKSQGLQYSITVADGGRFDFDRLVAVSNHAIGAGASRMDLTDSFDSLSPEAMTYFIRTYRSRLNKDVPVTLHVHDDFGIGNGVALAAAAGGAHPDVAVNGVSYRAGFAVLEEMAVTLEVLYGIDTGIKLEKLKALSELVADRIGLPIPALKPLTGPHAFLRDLPGLAVDLLEGGPDGFPPSGSCIAPSMVGAQMKFAWGHRNSRGIVRSVLKVMGLEASEDQVIQIQQRLNERLQSVTQYPHWLDEDNVKAVCREVLAASPTAG